MLDVNYIAGFFDADGNFGISPARKGFQPFACFTNTHSGVLTAIQFTLAGWEVKSRIYTIRKDVATHRQKWSLGVHGRDSVYDLCVALHPYLVVKQRRAELIMEFVSIRRSCISLLNSHYHQPREADIANEMKELNRKGI